MTSLTHKRKCQSEGSVLLAASVLLAIAAIAVGSILLSGTTYSRINARAYHFERAFELADSGVLAAVMSLNTGGSGTISRENSRTYFSATNHFVGSDWGFTTEITDIGGDVKRVVSRGRYGVDEAVVTADLALATGARTIHALYAHAIYAGNSSGSTNYVLEFGGTGSGADEVNGDVYSGNDIDVTGDAILRNPEDFVDANADGEWDTTEEWEDAYAVADFTNGMTRAEFDAYTSGVDRARCYPNGIYDVGEPFVDSIGNGVYDEGEAFTDLDGDGEHGFGEPFTDLDGDGVFDPNEEFVDLGNGEYDAGEEFEDLNGNGVRDPETPAWDEVVWQWWRWVTIHHPATPGEPFEDEGNGVYDEGESFADRNGVYDDGELFFDDRNGRYDYGAQAVSNISGMAAPGPGQMAAAGSCAPIDPPDLAHMYYETGKTGPAPENALDGWGHDVDVAAGNYDSNGRITDRSDPRHIFVRNPSGVQYEKIQGQDDYFLEDPTDPSYGNSHQFLTVNENGNNKLYFVDGNLYIHNPHTYDFMFRNPGVKITIVAKGNITISDEFWYNGGVENPQDSLCLIAMKDSGQPDSGNIYLGDEQFGTGGDIHALLYAQNNFIDNNLDTTGQPYLRVFGNMTAGNHVSLNRGGPRRTRLDVTLDERVVSRSDLPPGLPSSGSSERRIIVDYSWGVVKGSWHVHSTLQ